MWTLASTLAVISTRLNTSSSIADCSTHIEQFAIAIALHVWILHRVAGSPWKGTKICQFAAVHVARMGRQGNAYRLLVGKPMEREQ